MLKWQNGEISYFSSIWLKSFNLIDNLLLVVTMFQVLSSEQTKTAFEKKSNF